MSKTFGKMGTRASDLKLQLCDINNIDGHISWRHQWKSQKAKSGVYSITFLQIPDPFNHLLRCSGKIHQGIQQML